MSIFTFLGGSVARSGYQLERDVEDAMESANAAWDIEHKETGRHGDVTVDSIGTNDGSPLRWSTGVQFLSGPLNVDESGDPASPVAAIRATITASENNWTPSGINDAVVVEVTSTSAVSITGIYQNANIRRLLWLVNRGSYTITLANESGSSSAAYRMKFPSGNYALLAGSIVLLYYDPGTLVWRGGSQSVIKSIQQGTISYASAGTGATATITAVDTAKAVLSFTGETGDTNSGQTTNHANTSRLTLTNSTTVTATRQAGTAGGQDQGGTVGWVVTEFY